MSENENGKGGLSPTGTTKSVERTGCVPVYIVLWFGGFLIFSMVASLLFIPHSAVCEPGLLGDISRLFRNIPEVDSLSMGSSFGCQVSLCAGLALVFGPLLGGVVNLTRIDREALRKIDKGKSKVSRFLTLTFMFLLVISPYTFANKVSKPHQMSYSFFALVGESEYVLLAYSIGLLVFLTVVWAYLIHNLFFFGGKK